MQNEGSFGQLIWIFHDVEVIFSDTWSRFSILKSFLAMTCHRWLDLVMTNIGGVRAVDSLGVGDLVSDLVSMVDKSSLEVSISGVDELEESGSSKSFLRMVRICWLVLLVTELVFGLGFLAVV